MEQQDCFSSLPLNGNQPIRVDYNRSHDLTKLLPFEPISLTSSGLEHNCSIFSQSQVLQVLWLTRIDQEEVFVVRFFWKEQESYILFGLPGSRQQKFLVLRFFDIKEQQGIDRSTYLVNRSPSLAIGLKKPVDMLGSFVWLASIKQGILKPVLQGVEFEVEPQEDHTFEVEPHGNVDHVAGSQEVQTHDLIDYQLARDREQHLAYELFGYREDSNEAAFVVDAVKKIYAHESLTFNNTVSCEVISKWKAGLKDDMDARSDVYVLSNGYRKCSNDSDGYYWGINQGLLAKAKGNILSMEIVRDHSGNTLRVSQSRFYNEKLVQTLLEGHSILLLKGSLLGDCNVEKNSKWSCIYAVGRQEYQMVCTRLDIASVDVGMLDKFDRGLQTDVQAFVDFNYAMERSITVKGYMTFIDAWKKEIWLKGLLTESRYELKLVAGIATGCLDEGGTWTQVTTLLGVAECWYSHRVLVGNYYLPLIFIKGGEGE
nr:zinc finger, CCHC-type [Tanacetum cinerariifolium]